ncbi:hypothetical protein H0O02_01095 [Candidatus Micrarchaeota archaeon]|nr:hypothetical protein [Candidatus Micrarchaeota archaeon]
MVAPKEKETEQEFPKITFTKPPQTEEVARLKLIPKPIIKEVKEEAGRAMGEAEKNTVKVVNSFTDFFTVELSKTADGKRFLSNMTKNSEIGNLLF